MNKLESELVYYDHITPTPRLFASMRLHFLFNSPFNTGILSTVYPVMSILLGLLAYQMVDRLPEFELALIHCHSRLAILYESDLFRKSYFQPRTAH